ncbi:hypothetical protein CC86DRAFT_338326 [Ophiobolus disseminans]|uniref:Uncharacterized protein n=1 Tax=Ophiobolus disseminans TaxID=1469910 RepID=A0A6A7AKA1_9PLEO|nr:hypothetical protein CC86DRAFT_338326 [Ophiobolus disseminans]
MQQKLKAVFRSSSRKKAPSDDADAQSEATSPRSARVDRRATSLDEQRRRQSAEAHGGRAQHNARSRPLSSAYDSRRPHNNPPGPVAFDYAQPYSSEPVDDSIASDYKAYLPVLTPVHDSNDEQHMTLGGDRRLITGESAGLHEEDVADRNISQYRTSLDVSKRKPLPATPVLGTTDPGSSRKISVGAGSLGSTISTVPSAATGRYSLGGDVTTKGGLQDNESHVSWGRRRPGGSESDDNTPRMPPDNLRSREITPTADGQYEIEKEIEQLLDGVVDLRNTVDEDKDVQWAPVVTHEVVKPHRHEIVQHKIFREIHNYEYFHRIQPVYDIEVLPPRHWIPNPDGEGLIEISADELPSRTGANRRWKIVHEQVEPSTAQTPMWRTEPQIIEHPTTITEEGFERKETTIIHPPTLADMTEYDGLVQPVHFDHKTGERWLGQITTMHRLREEMGAVADPNLSLKELADNLPEVPASPQSPGLKRKPVHGPVPAQLGELGRNDGIAIAV